VLRLAGEPIDVGLEDAPPAEVAAELDNLPNPTI
jgi:hypothetical protein